MIRKIEYLLALYFFYGLAESFVCVGSPKVLRFCYFTSLCVLSYPTELFEIRFKKQNKKPPE